MGLDEAEKGRSQDEKCKMVYDNRCNGDKFFTCRGVALHSSQGSCVWEKHTSGGHERGDEEEQVHNLDKASLLEEQIYEHVNNKTMGHTEIINEISVKKTQEHSTIQRKI